ncbi:TetR/AcrR family transcriptional regulator [Paenibacillus chondroitinus]|uniref:TetR/AcrR family transcriptional regulator n=1 Tax=Paenibacillus chondroitinus TaxID=59842 RepID=A0ABU6DCI8_9BACL|nr:MULTISPECIES: TetR/AcrR family transcriptional regulator [Paenibacillus]MCY9659906.1 TetR/AcrR family transcriptional regulator [Paenibacillus anseongense]MEB4795476.1 TetR/AcrR family transcriptional regulator [Paenibacillus chondroitinus]
MKKGDRTREHIIMKSAEIFNQKGFAGTSLNDIIADTGIKKGGIYRHFSSKDEIALEAYNYAASLVTRKFSEAVDQEQSASGRLIAFFRVYEDVVNNPPFIGGCPMQNTAVECDDTHTELRDRARQGLNAYLDIIKGIIRDGIETGEFKEDLDSNALASFAISLLEGGIMLSKLDGDNKHMQMNTASFSIYLQQCCLKIR